MADTKTPRARKKGFGDTVYGENELPETDLQALQSEAQSRTPTTNAAAMRGYLRNAPYLEGIINSPESIKEELGLLGYAPEDDVVSQYRKRVLMQALQDIYNINPYLVGPGHALTRGMSQTPDAGYTSTTPSGTPGPTTPRGR